MFARLRVPAFVGIALAICFASGCDGGGAKRTALYQQLVGTWEIQRMQLDGTTISFSDETVRLEFLSQDEGRSYRLTRAARGDTSTVTGAVGIPESNVLRMTGDFSLVWRFDFEEPDDLSDSVRFRLARASEGSSESFLDAIGLNGRARSIVMDLVRTPE
jgi:hypothetical protein